MSRAERLNLPIDLPTMAARLRELEKRVARLTVHHGDPERFFVERSELKAGIGAVAKQLEGGRLERRQEEKPPHGSSRG
jgi:hypothetical protein